MEINELKQRYNNLIIRTYKAEKFFEKCKKEDIDKNLIYLTKILNEMESITREIRKMGYTITDDEILGGFVI